MIKIYSGFSKVINFSAFQENKIFPGLIDADIAEIKVCIDDKEYTKTGGAITITSEPNATFDLTIPSTGLTGTDTLDVGRGTAKGYIEFNVGDPVFFDFAYEVFEKPC